MICCIIFLYIIFFPPLASISSLVLSELHNFGVLVNRFLVIVGDLFCTQSMIGLGLGLILLD